MTQFDPVPDLIPLVCLRCGATLEPEALACACCGEPVIPNEPPASWSDFSDQKDAWLVETISSILIKPEDCDFMVTRIGDYYIQWRVEQAASCAVLCEAVSNANLPLRSQLLPPQSAALEALNFVRFANGNFKRHFKLNSRLRIEEFVSLVRRIYTEIYYCPPTTDIELEDADWCGV